MDAFTFTLIFLAAIVAFLWHLRESGKQRHQEAQKVEETERKRLLECEEVVRYFANCYGYLARAVVRRDELDNVLAPVCFETTSDDPDAK